MVLARLLARWTTARNPSYQPAASASAVLDRTEDEYGRPLVRIVIVIAVVILLVLFLHRVARMDRRFFAVSPPGLWGLALYLSGEHRGAAAAYRAHWKHEMANLKYEDRELVALLQGDLATAERLARVRLESSPMKTSALITMAEIALARQTPQQALVFLGRVLDREPDTSDALFLRSAAHAQAGDYGEAIAWANRSLRQWNRNERLSTFLRLLEVVGALEKLPDERRPLALLANYYRYLAQLDPGQEAGVLRYADLAIRRGDHVPDAHLAIGAVRHRRRQREAALTAFLQAVDADPRHAEARRWAALSYSERGDLPNEYRMARAAHEASPEDSYYLRLVVTVLIEKLGDYRAALEVIRTANVRDWEALMWLGHIHFSLREYALGLDSYRAAAKLRPDDANAHQGIGQGLSALGRLDDAAHALQRAVELAPSGPELRFELGYVYRKQRKYVEATREFETGIAGGGATADHQTTLCSLYLRIGKLERSVACYEAFVAAHPDHVGARRALSFIRPGVAPASKP